MGYVHHDFRGEMTVTEAVSKGTVEVAETLQAKLIAKKCIDNTQFPQIC